MTKPANIRTSFNYDLVDLKNLAVSRPALERAKYKCEMCGGEDNLRVVQRREEIVVLCAKDRLRGWPYNFVEQRADQLAGWLK